MHVHEVGADSGLSHAAGPLYQQPPRARVREKIHMALPEIVKRATVTGAGTAAMGSYIGGGG